MLFSEPKIPHRHLASGRNQLSAFQCSSASRKFLTTTVWRWPYARLGFSALQRAENSSHSARVTGPLSRQRFSALQRAENSSPYDLDIIGASDPPFQCSSASRKFLTICLLCASISIRTFQCSSASRKFLTVPVVRFSHNPLQVSVLFSEPKIPHSARG